MWEGTGKRFKWYSMHVNFETKLSEVGEPEKRYLWPGILHLGNVLTVMNGSSGCEHLQYTMQERNETGLLPGLSHLP